MLSQTNLHRVAAPEQFADHYELVDLLGVRDTAEPRTLDLSVLNTVLLKQLLIVEPTHRG